MNNERDTDVRYCLIWRALFAAAEQVQSRFEDGLAASGLSLSKLGVLGHLVDQGQPIPLSRLAGKMSCVKSNITQLIDKLESDGLVERVYDPADRRSVLAAITALGREKYAEGSALIRQIETEVFGGIDSADLQTFERVLKAFGPSPCP